MQWIEDWTHHHAGGDGDPSAAVGVRHDVAVADTEEGDGDEPHGVEEVGVLLVMIPVTCHSVKRTNPVRKSPQLLTVVFPWLNIQHLFHCERLPSSCLVLTRR